MDVAIAGGGPTGLMLACELRLAGVDVVVLERLAEPSGESRAGGLHARTLEVLDQRGMVEPFLAAGRVLQAGHFSGLRLDFSGFESRHPYMLALLQRHVERLLEEHALALGATIRRSVEVTGFTQDADGVDVSLAAGASTERIRARYLVGCDGGRSTVRRLAGIGFPGTDATMTALIGDVELREPPARDVFQERHDVGNFSVLQFEPGWHRVMTNEFDRVVDRRTPVTLDDLRATMVRICGSDFGMHSPRMISRFNDAARQATAYRAGRVLLAGDAAHIHFPAGGQGLNTGVQDAVNLGWKLAAVVLERSDPALLDTYHDERHPIAARVLHNTRAQTALSRTGPHLEALRDVVGSLITLDDVNRRLGLMVTGLDIRYPMGDGHPLLGLRAPDADLSTGRLFELLYGMSAILLDLTGELSDFPVPPGVTLVESRALSPHWTVPVAGEVDVPGALLIRPDGHIAWAAPMSREALGSALRTWC